MQKVKPVLEVRGVSRSFGGVQALVDIDFDILPGEVHALVGENGAGKSTLIKLLSGVHQPDVGEIWLRGYPVRLASPAKALRLGIAAVHQEFSYCPDLSVLENLYLGRDLPLTRFGTVNWDAANQHADEVLSSIGISVDLKSPIKALNSTHRKLVEIGRGILFQASILILDEPTAALPSEDIQHLQAVVKRLKDTGVAVIYITHHLHELPHIADRVTVLRDGHKITTHPMKDLSEDELIRLMIGRSLNALFPKQDTTIGDPILEIENLSVTGVIQNISFRLHRGEILGLAGLVGAGRSELAQAIVGILPLESGTISVDRKQYHIRDVDDAIKAGIAYVPEDRQHQGLILGMNIADNVTLPILERFSSWLFVNERKQLAFVEESRERLHINFYRPQQRVSNLSGGNQQKCVLAKWIGTKPRILIVDEPTHGIDVGAKAEIHALISAMAADGMGIIMISSDLPEVLGMSDRVLVLHEGRVSAEFSHDTLDPELIMQAAMGRQQERRS